MVSLLPNIGMDLPKDLHHIEKFFPYSVASYIFWLEEKRLSKDARLKKLQEITSDARTVWALRCKFCLRNNDADSHAL